MRSAQLAYAWQAATAAAAAAAAAAGKVDSGGDGGGGGITAATAVRDVQVPLVGASGVVHGMALCTGLSKKPLYISIGAYGCCLV